MVSPRDHMSAAYGLVSVESGLVVFRRSSGAINCRVPLMVDGGPRLSSIRFETPKSVILTHHGLGGWDLMRMF